MAFSRFARTVTNRVLNAATVLKNGTGGGAPALVQDAAYPMANLQTADRYSVWSTGASPPGPTLVHYDLGADQSVLFVGILGLRGVNDAAITPITCDVGKRTAAQGYSGTAADYTDVASFGDGRRDLAATITAASGRYWQFEFNALPSTGFSIGKLMLSTALTDLGILYSPGAEVAIIKPQVRTRTPGGAQAATYLGDARRRFTFPYRTVDATLLGTLRTLGTQVDPFVYFDHEGNVYECLADPEFASQHVWATPTGVHDAALVFEQLP
jgi:hypothetical protein